MPDRTAILENIKTRLREIAICVIRDELSDKTENEIIQFLFNHENGISQTVNECINDLVEHYEPQHSIDTLLVQSNDWILIGLVKILLPIYVSI